MTVRRVEFSEDEVCGDDVGAGVDEASGEGVGGLVGRLSLEGAGHDVDVVEEAREPQFERTNADIAQPAFKVIPEWEAGGLGEGAGEECLHCKGALGLPAHKLCTECMSAWFCSAECIKAGRRDHRAGCEAVQVRNKALEAMIARVDAMDFPDLPAHLLPKHTKKCVHTTLSPRPSPCGLCGRERVMPVLFKCGHEFCNRCLDEYQTERLFRGLECKACPHESCAPKLTRKKQKPGPQLWDEVASELMRQASPPRMSADQRENLLAQAEDLWCKVIEADPILIDHKWTPRAYLGLSAVAKLRGEFQAEGSLLQQMCELVPGDPLAAANFALWKNRMHNDFESALSILSEAERDCQPSLRKAMPNERVTAGIGVSCASAQNVAPVFHIACIDSMVRKSAWEDDHIEELEGEDVIRRYSELSEHLLSALEIGRGNRAVERYVLPILANVSIEMENWEEARKWLLMSELEFDVLVQLSAVNIELEDYKEAKRCALQAIRLRNDVSMPFVLLAKALVGLGQLENAIEAMHAALAVDPLDIDYLLYIVVLLRTRKLEETHAYKQKLKEQKRRSISSSIEGPTEEELQAKAFVDAHKEMEEKLERESEEELLERIASDPSYSECDFALRCAVALDPLRAEVHRDLGALLYQLGGKAAGEIGLRSFQKALEYANPDQYEEWLDELGLASLENFTMDEEGRKPYWFGKKRRWMSKSNGDGIEYAEIDESGQRKDRNMRDMDRKSSVARRIGRRWARKSRELASGVVNNVGKIMGLLAQAKAAGQS